jgi:hypothetical protein
MIGVCYAKNLRTLYHRKAQRHKKVFLTLNPSRGSPASVLLEWRRKSFENFPDCLAEYRMPKTKGAAETGAMLLIRHVKRNLEAGVMASTDAATVGKRLEKLTEADGDPARRGL